MSAARIPARNTATAIVIVAGALMTIGVVMIASTSAELNRSILRVDFWRSTFGRQAIFVAAGFLAMLLFMRIGYPLFAWRAHSVFQPATLVFLLSLAALAAVLVPGVGVARNGARRWLQFGPADLGLGFQPSELGKLALVVFLAGMLSRDQARRHPVARQEPRPPTTARRESAPPRRICDTADLRPRPHSVMLRFRTVLFGAAAIGICAGLVGIEDFGTAALLAAVGGLMLLAGGARLAHLALLALPGLAAFAYLLIAKPYRLERLTAFRNIWADPRGQGYHAIQSLATIASGGWFGRGLGNGVQKFGYLPEARTDFIFSVICEETGLFGAFVVMLLFAGLVWLGIACVRAAPTALGRLLALGITLLIGLQAAMNVAVVTVAAPTKGIALPLVSAGGSGILFLGAAIGLAASVAYRASWPAAAGDTDCGLRNANFGLDNPQSAIRNPQSAGAMA